MIPVGMIRHGAGEVLPPQEDLDPDVIDDEQSEDEIEEGDE